MLKKRGWSSSSEALKVSETMKRREVLLDQKHMDSQHMMQNGNHGNSDKFHCHLCNFDGVNIEEFDLHMNSEVHMQRMASISSLYQARTEQQVQRMKAEQMLRRLERDDSDMCDICQKKVTTSFAEHRSNTEHVRKERMTKRGCILCKTGSFDNYPSYVVHIDSDSHKQAKNKLNVDLEMKKDSSETNPKSHDLRRRPSRESHDSSKSHDSSRSHESTRRTTRDSHDSHRRHNESDDRQRRKSAESTQDSHNKRHESHSSSSRHRHQRNSSAERENREIHHHRSEDERRGSSENKAQNRDNKQEEVGNKETEMVDLAKVKHEPVEDQKPVVEEEEEVEMVQEELIYDPDVAVGSEFVIPVKGFFCKLCHKFYNSEELARNIHCKAEKHFEKYQEYVISQQQEASDLPPSKPAQPMIQGSIKTEKGSSNKFHSHKKNSMDQEMEQLSIKISNVQSVSQDVAFQDNIDSNHTMEVEASNPSNGMGDAPIKREPSLSQQTSNRKLRLSRRGRNN